MLKVFALSLLSFAMVYGADDKTKSPSFADEAFNKALEGNASDAVKAYGDYMNKLDVANKKVLAALEVVKKDLNDTGKNKGLSIQERADAIKAIDERIASIKRDGVGEAVQGKVVAKADLLGDVKSKVDIGKEVLGKWTRPDGTLFEFAKGGIMTTSQGSRSAYVIQGNEIVVNNPGGLIYNIVFIEGASDSLNVKNNRGGSFVLTRTK